MQIIIDTREKAGVWDFPVEVCQNPTIRKLDTGDYSLEGFETLLTIERKKSVAELAQNLVDSRFKRELTRMGTYKYSFIIAEFDIDDILKYPIGSTVPKYKWDKLKVNSKLIMSLIAHIQVHYNTNIIFAGCRSNAIIIATNIMRKVYEKYTPREIFER